MSHEEGKMLLNICTYLCISIYVHVALFGDRKKWKREKDVNCGYIFKYIGNLVFKHKPV